MTTLTEAVRASSTPGSTRKRAARVRRETTRAPRAYYWMVWPAVIAFAFFHTLPVLIGIFFSFTNYPGYGDWDFIGISNYVNLFKDDRVLQAYGFSFLFAIVATVLTNAISLAIALGLNAKIKARNFWRGVYFVPYVLAILVIGYVFQFFFSNSLPKILSGIPLFADNILTNETWAWTAIVALAVWQAITFSIISAFFTINIVLSLKGFLQVFDPIVALTNGGPGTSTESVTLLIFRGGFSGGEFAYQTANAVIFFIVITVVSLLQFRVLQRREADF